MNDEYAYEVFPDLLSTGEVTLVARYPDLPGCQGVGTTQAEALRDLEVSKRAYIEASEKAGLPVPPPTVKHSLIWILTTTKEMKFIAAPA